MTNHPLILWSDHAMGGHPCLHLARPKLNSPEIWSWALLFCILRQVKTCLAYCHALQLTVALQQVHGVHNTEMYKLLTAYTNQGTASRQLAPVVPVLQSSVQSCACSILSLMTLPSQEWR